MKNPTKRTEERLTIRKLIYLLKPLSQMAPRTIIGTHINKKWEEQGMDHAWEYKNTRINRVLNHQNFF